jgi:hypothetical protein
MRRRNGEKRGRERYGRKKGGEGEEMKINRRKRRRLLKCRRRGIRVGEEG